MPKAAPKGEKLTLSKIAKELSDEAKAWEFMESLRWPNGPICPHCTSTNAYFLQPRADRYSRTGHATQRRVWKCAKCRKQFSCLVGTVFQDSKIPLSKWLLAVHLMCAAKNGVSSVELARTLEITQKSAWFMAHRIRYALEQKPLQDLLRGVVGADETYMGGKRRGVHGRPGPGSKKMPVVTLIERGGEARSQVMDRVTGANIKAALDQHMAADARLMTDNFPVYRKPGQRFASHEIVDHTSGEYVRGDVHVNTAEGYFSQLKRSVDGTHHHVSRQHLHRYLSEFDYRYNTRKVEDGEWTVRAIKQTEGKRLMDRTSTAQKDAV